MGWFNDIVDKVVEVATDAGNAIQQAAEDIGNAIKGTGEDAANAAQEAAEKAAQLAREQAEKAAEAAKEAAEAAAEAAKLAAEKTADAARLASEAAAGSVAHGFLSFAGTVDRAATTAWEATSDEANAIVTTIESTGVEIGTDFIAGGKIIQQGLETAAEQTGKGLVEAGRYITRHVCDIAVGSALSAIFVALSVDGEEEASVASIAALSATQFADKAALDAAAHGLAVLIAAPISRIPGVDQAFDGEENLTSVITFLIVKACTEDPKLVWGSAGQYLAGVLIYGITSVVCEGEIPGGYTVWKGAQTTVPS